MIKRPANAESRSTLRARDVPLPEGSLVVVVGPTASGKTALAIELAERWGGEIVGADSVQVYREFDVGSGKPTAEERARAPHHLVGVFDPMEPVDAKRWASLADETIAEIRARGRVPIVCGGTFLWVRALVKGLAPAPPADPEVRARHAAIVASEGRSALHERLVKIDPASAVRLNPNDVVRVSRALEIFELSGKTQSAFFAEHGFREDRYPHVLLGVDRPRGELDRRIEARTRRWLEEGWIDEVKGLLERGYGEARAMGSVGYAQIKGHLEGAVAEAELSDSIVRATRVFVRRQRTWLRDEAVTWVEGA